MMIGIYKKSFVDYLKNKLGDRVKITTKDIIVPCPWCEYNQDKDHYHLYIWLNEPMFHCFHAGCEKKGFIKKLLMRLEGYDITENFVDKETLKEVKKRSQIFIDRDQTKTTLHIPPLNRSQFMLKDMYVKKRLKFASTSTSMINGLVYDINQFVEINRIPIDERLFRVKDYLQSNFVGFLTENSSTLMLRNIDHSHSFKFYKLKIQPANFLDYYKLPGNNPKSKKIVLAEGIFDIFTEHIFDSINMKNEVKLYASALSSKYLSLIHGIIFNEQIFQPEVIILSDRGVGRDYYKKMKLYNKHIIDKLTVYYNKAAKDFNDTPVVPTKYVM